MTLDKAKWTDKAIVLLTVGIVVVSALQWHEMRAGSTDTHALAVAAKAQADASKAQADAAVKSEADTHDLAVQAAKQAEAAKHSSDTARRTLDASSRAWIAPDNAYFTSDIAKHVPPTFVVEYRNTGKSPAFDVHPIFKLEQVPVSKFDDNTFNAFIETSDICKNLKLAPGADVVYPDMPDSYKFIFTTHVPEWVGDDVVDGRNAVVLRMCFAYRTMQQMHLTSFCYFYRAGISPPNKQMNICTAGNHAD